MVLFSTDYFWLHLVYVFVFGLVFGSFFNVCIYRIPKEESIVFPGSHCPKCGKKIKWYDNIPLISYVILKGRCRACQKPISFRYFFVELITGVSFSLVFYIHRYNWATLAYIILTGMLIIITFTDLDNWIIPDEVTYIGVIIGLIFGILAPLLGNNFIISNVNFDKSFYFAPLVNALIGCASGVVLFYGIGVLGKLIFRKEAMGLGDVKLMGMVGIFTGWKNVVLILVLASFLGSIIGGGVMLIMKLFKSKTEEVENKTQIEKEKNIRQDEQDKEPIENFKQTTDNYCPPSSVNNNSTNQSPTPNPQPPIPNDSISCHSERSEESNN
jgi:leader peptidase (prepilin peptidase)/N-methyltransferase